MSDLLIIFFDFIFEIEYPALSIITNSSSSKYITFLVCSIMGDASLAKKYSPSPIPKTSGLPIRAAIILFGSSAHIVTIP